MLKTISYIILFICAFLLYTRLAEHRTTFFPMKEMNEDPSFIGLEFEDTYFASGRGVILNAWFIPGEGEKTLLFCHGNAGNISHRLEKIKIFHDLGLNVFIFDYRGYGKSRGRPSEKGIYEDARSAYNYLIERKNIPADKIVVFGESLGAAAAIELASKNKLGGLITEEAFSSAKDMARSIAPFLWHFVPGNRFNSLAKIGSIRTPKLIMHSADDEIVNFTQSEKLYQAATPPKEFIKLRGSHNTAYFESGDTYRETIKAFLDKYL